MRFEYVEADSFEDVGSGTVLHSAPGFPGFPARLALELFDRARAMTSRERVTLWDPMCGAGGLVAAIALRRRAQLEHVIATDVDAAAVELARRNLALVDSDALLKRADELESQGAASTRTQAARNLASAVGSPPLPFTTGVVDVTAAESVAAFSCPPADIVITDIPYGTQTTWNSTTSSPLPTMIEALRSRLPAHAVIVLTGPDRNSFADCPTPLRSFKHGRRVIKLLAAHP